MIHRHRCLVLSMVFVVYLLLPCSQAYSSNIVVSPGKFDRFIITLPERVHAGDETHINIHASDNLGNIIKDFHTYDKEFVLTVTGSATLNTKTIKASAFSNGVITVIFRDTVAEKAVLSIRESNNLIPLITKEINVLPSVLKSFTLKAPKVARAGERFEVYISAKDAYGNVYTDTVSGKNLNFTFKGDADVRVDMPILPDVANGVCKVTLLSEKTGTVVIEVKDVITGSSGTSELIEIINGNVNSFKVLAPKEAVAGEPFEVSIAAIDRFGNVVVDYASYGKGINIKTTGKSTPFPSTVPAYEFNNGQAKISLRYDTAETVVLNVSEIGGNQVGVTEPISVVLPKPDRFEITTPDTVVAGQKFKIKITVFSQNNKVIKNYNLVGSDVVLKTTGTGVLMPNRIPPSEFINGTAVVEVQYNKAEAFKITATVADDTPSVERPISEARAKKDPAPPSVLPKTHKKQTTQEQQTKPTKRTKKYEITNLTIVESKKTSTITAHISGMDDRISYSLLTDKAAKDKKVIILKIKSAVSKVDKDLAFESNFVKNIRIQEDPKDEGVVLITMEQLKPTRFKLQKGKGSISVVFGG